MTHPLVIHFPIVLLILYSIAEVYQLISGNYKLNSMLLIILGAGIVAAIGAVISGNAEASSIATNSLPLKETIEAHETWATFTLFTFTGIFLIKISSIKSKSKKQLRFIILFLVILGCIFVYLTGTTGGKLVYKYGVGTELFKNSTKTK